MIKINMGCGRRNFGTGWIHIDGGDYPHLDYKDITKLNFKDESVDLVYASHVLEYFDREDVLEVLKEWRRVLKKNSILRLAVPDFAVMSKLYVEGKYPIQNFLGPLYGKIQMAEKKIYHKTTYDFESLEKILLESGFKNIKKYDWQNTEHSHIDDQSQAYLPHMDKENGTLISLNIECNKE